MDLFGKSICLIFFNYMHLKKNNFETLLIDACDSKPKDCHVFY